MAGAALVVACAWRLAFAFSAESRLRRLVQASLAAMLALLVGFGLVVQKDYARAWDLQRRFWTSMVPFASGMGEGTVILVDPAGLIDTRQIDANTWNLPLVLQYIYEFPSDWDPAPRVHRLLPDWKVRSLHNELEIKAVDFKWEYVVVPWDKAILVETLNGWVMQRVSEVEFQGDDFRLGSEPLLGTGAIQSRGFQ